MDGAVFSDLFFLISFGAKLGLKKKHHLYIVADFWPQQFFFAHPPIPGLLKFFFFSNFYLILLQFLSG